MSPIIALGVADFGKPHHHMGYAAPDFVIATRAPVDLDGPRAGNRQDDVFVAVWAGLHALLQRQRP